MSKDKEERSPLIVNESELVGWTQEEKDALMAYLKSNKLYNMSPNTASSFLSLYLEGRTIEQIHKTFPSWPIGSLLHARYFYKWDEQVKQYFNQLASTVRDRILKSQAETAHHLMDKLSVLNKEFRNEMDKYLQSPLDENLPSNRIKSTRELKETITILKEIINLTQPANAASPPVLVNINTEGNSKIQISSQEHSDILKQLASKNEKKSDTDTPKDE